MSKEIKFNINEYVRIKLNPDGIEIYESRYDVLIDRQKKYGIEGTKRPIYSEDCDGEGYIKMQMWYFMELFGEHISIVKNPPFESNIFFIVEEE